MMGADHTSYPLRLVFEAIFGTVNNARWEILHSLIRKSGHFLGYGAIGLAWFRALKLTFPHSRLIQDSILALIGTALVASADEFHQAFLPNRTGSLWDVLLDSSGVIALQLAFYISKRLFRPKNLALAA
jgi:VanZ family protein